MEHWGLVVGALVALAVVVGLGVLALVSATVLVLVRYQGSLTKAAELIARHAANVSDYERKAVADATAMGRIPATADVSGPVLNPAVTRAQNRLTEIARGLAEEEA